MNKTIYSLVVINEDMEIVEVSAYLTRDKAEDALEQDYKDTKKMLEAEGWGQDELSGDEFDCMNSYWIQYGSSSYYAEIKEITLYE